MVDRRAVERFAESLPPELRGAPAAWTTRAILGGFRDCWKLLAWSRFLKRLDEVSRA
jgi:hypothetical protein